MTEAERIAGILKSEIYDRAFSDYIDNNDIDLQLCGICEDTDEAVEIAEIEAIAVLEKYCIKNKIPYNG